jgi:hypothetical protein
VRIYCMHTGTKATLLYAQVYVHVCTNIYVRIGMHSLSAIARSAHTQPYTLARSCIR